MKKRVLVFILIGVILFGGLLLRTWKVTKIPAILNRDEAAIAYNALLLSQTGKDEWGKTWPIALQSFGDYKLIGYPVATILSFKVFGENDFAVKFPSILAGFALMAVSWIWARRVCHFSSLWSLFLLASLALQPIFIFYSRIAFEANLALALFFCSLILLFRETTNDSPQKNILLDACAAGLLLLSSFTYNTPLLLLPFLAPIVLYFRGVRSPKKWLPALFFIALTFAIGMTSLLGLSKQKSGITIFSDENTTIAMAENHQRFSGLSQKILGNKWIFYSDLAARRYAETFSPNFLVIRGGQHPWHSLPGWGHLLWITYCLGWVGILLAVWQFIKSVANKKSLKSSQRTLIVCVLLLLISPLPAVITVDAPHATRSLLFFLMWVVLSVYGARECAVQLRWRLLSFLLFVVLILESFFYVRAYFENYPQQSTAILRGGYAQAIRDLEKDQKAAPALIVDDGGYQYVLTAWYLHTSPADFFQTVEKQLPDPIGFRYGYKLGKYRFVKSANDAFPEEKAVLEWNHESAQWLRKDR